MSKRVNSLALVFLQVFILLPFAYNASAFTNIKNFLQPCKAFSTIFLRYFLSLRKIGTKMVSWYRPQYAIYFILIFFKALIICSANFLYPSALK